MIEGCLKICSILPLLLRAPGGGEFFVRHYFCPSRFWKIPIKHKLIKQGCQIFLWRLPIMVEGSHKICSILPLLLRASGGVTILKIHYKTKIQKVGSYFFSVEGTYHRGSMPLMFLGVLTFITFCFIGIFQNRDPPPGSRTNWARRPKQ